MGGGEHDWNYLLGRLGLLQQDRLIGSGVRLVGVLMYVWSSLMGWTYASGSAEPS